MLRAGEFFGMRGPMAACVSHRMASMLLHWIPGKPCRSGISSPAGKLEELVKTSTRSRLSHGRPALKCWLLDPGPNKVIYVSGISTLVTKCETSAGIVTGYCPWPFQVMAQFSRQEDMIGRFASGIGALVENMVDVPVTMIGFTH